MSKFKDTLDFVQNQWATIVVVAIIVSPLIWVGVKVLHKAHLETLQSDVRSLESQLNIKTTEYNSLYNRYNELFEDHNHLTAKHNELEDSFNELRRLVQELNSQLDENSPKIILDDTGGEINFGQQ